MSTINIASTAVRHETIRLDSREATEVQKNDTPHLPISQAVGDSKVKLNLALEADIGNVTESVKLLKFEAFDESVKLENDESAFVKCDSPVNVEDVGSINVSMEGSKDGDSRSIISQGTESTNTDRRDELTEDNNFEELGHRLKLLQCPFTWDFTHTDVDDNPEKVIMNMFEKESKDEGDSLYMWRQIVFKLVLCYAYSKLGDVAQALKATQECLEPMSVLVTAGMLEAVTHVVRACEGHLLYMSGRQGEARDTVDTIEPYQEMSDAGKGAIWGLRGALLLEGGPVGNKAAVNCMETALQFDPSQGEWHFMLGMSLLRIRHIEDFQSVPQERERLALEQAVEVSKMPAYMLFLAQSYNESVFNMLRKAHYRSNPEMKVKLRDLSERSAQLYKDCLALKPDCPYTLVRCALGFMKLASPHKDMVQARECVERALVLMPNHTMANHVAGSVYENLGLLPQAIEHLEFAGQQGAFGAHMGLAKLRFKMDPLRDMMPDLESYLQQHRQPCQQHHILLMMGAYQLYVKGDFLSALPHWMQVIREFPNLDMLQNFKCEYMGNCQSIKIFQVILQQAQTASTNEKTDPALQEAIQMCGDQGLVPRGNRHQSEERVPSRDSRRDGAGSQDRGGYSQRSRSNYKCRQEGSKYDCKEPSRSDLDRNWRK